MARVISIGGRFQLAEQARAFKDLGVVYVESKGVENTKAIRAGNNLYDVVTLNPDGKFDKETVSLEAALSIIPENLASRFDMEIPTSIFSNFLNRSMSLVTSLDFVRIVIKALVPTKHSRIFRVFSYFFSRGM